MKQLTKQIIDDIYAETGIAPSYIEKDWYLVLVLQVILSLNKDNIKAVFAGGTSLSKGYNLIHRFSEDVDFSIIGIKDSNRAARGQYRDNLIEKINATDVLNVEMDSIKSKDKNKFTSFYINYPKEFDLDNSLRNNLKLELSFKSTYLEPIKKEINSFVGEYIEGCPKIGIDCISAIETAANKFSALMWRIDIKDRSRPFNHMFNDPALIRHLYDLSALYPLINNEPEFKRLVEQIYEIDKVRGNKNRDISLIDFINKTILTLKTDKLYKEEYEKYVSTMSYSSEPEVTFDKALQNYEELCKLFIR
ncbi:MAG: nucleotidyl transferase AbiEii/AbiGii toxin family protein [Alphaproteobacteria bacterium]